MKLWQYGQMASLCSGLADESYGSFKVLICCLSCDGSSVCKNTWVGAVEVAEMAYFDIELDDSYLVRRWRHVM
jgi:hypothetical protein